MGIIFGYLCLLCFCLLMAKSLTHKFHLVRADRMLMKIHRPLCVVLVVLCVLHFIFVLPVFSTRNIFIYITGIFMVLLLIIIIFFCCIKRKHNTKGLSRHRLLAGLMLLCMIGHILVYAIDFREYQTKISNIHLQQIHKSSIADGQYIGEYDAGYIYAKVKVTVLNGSIQNIILVEHKNERGQAAEKVVSDIVDTQTFPVDAISGATNSSKVIQKAVQNALK